MSTNIPSEDLRFSSRSSRNTNCTLYFSKSSLAVKEPLSLIEKYTFIQEKLASGTTKEEFCQKVGIDSSEFDSIMLIAGQPTEVRSLVEQNLISPTTLKLAKATADRNEWTQKQFEDFIQESVKLAQQLGKKESVCFFYAGCYL